MARRRRRTESQTRGRIVFGSTGRPICHHPTDGVARRIRTPGDVQRLRGEVAAEDMERASEWFKRHQEGQQ